MPRATAPFASPGAPHSRTEEKRGPGPHLTHALTLHAALPTGSVCGAEMPFAARKLPLASTSERFASPKGPEAKEAPAGEATVEKAATPSV